MIERLSYKENIFDDNIAFVEHWDFSTANTSEEDRIHAITQVASICYQSPTALGSESLYNRLMAESMGLPSSSFEFVPVLLDIQNPLHKVALDIPHANTKKFGEWLENGRYLLTNYRAIVYDWEQHGDRIAHDIRTIYNTQKEAEIIARYFQVFLYKVDLPTRSQMVRHRINWQELSRRYVSGKRVPFEFYISEKMTNITSNDLSTQQIIDLTIQHYFAALDKGIKPQEARRIIPQAAYTQIWGAFLPAQLENFFKLRLENHAQWEIRKVAEAMRTLIDTQ